MKFLVWLVLGALVFVTFGVTVAALVTFLVVTGVCLFLFHLSARWVEPEPPAALALSTPEAKDGSDACGDGGLELLGNAIGLGVDLFD